MFAKRMEEMQKQAKKENKAKFRAVRKKNAELLEAHDWRKTQKTYDRLCTKGTQKIREVNHSIQLGKWERER